MHGPDWCLVSACVFLFSIIYFYVIFSTFIFLASTEAKFFTIHESIKESTSTIN